MTQEIVSNVIIPRINDYCGIKIGAVHERNIVRYIENKISENKTTLENYTQKLVVGTKEFDELINCATVNETYFFREQIQFDFLHEQFFPKFKGRCVKIWSGACASGEEPLSLCALALSCGAVPEVFASDIDSSELEFFRNGIYKKYSFNNDGSKYKHLLEETYCGTFCDDEFRISQKCKTFFHIIRYNLKEQNPPDFFDKVDIVFIRNAFIYFDIPLRKHILENACKKLVPGGLLFLSVGEICCIEDSIIPRGMEKKNRGNVFYLQKTEGTAGEQTSVCETNCIKNTDSLKNSNAVNVASVKSQKQKKIPAQQNLNHSKECDDPKAAYEKINSFLAKQNYFEAELTARNLSLPMSKKFYQDYFIAMVLKSAKRYDEAKEYFESAQSFCPSFWPAFFYNGIMLKEQGLDKDASRSFEKCLAKLQKYLDANKTEFDFLSESFSPSYFINICKKLTLSESAYENR